MAENNCRIPLIKINGNELSPASSLLNYPNFLKAFFARYYGASLLLLRATRGLAVDPCFWQSAKADCNTIKGRMIWSVLAARGLASYRRDKKDIFPLLDSLPLPSGNGLSA